MTSMGLEFLETTKFYQNENPAYYLIIKTFSKCHCLSNYTRNIELLINSTAELCQLVFQSCTNGQA